MDMNSLQEVINKRAEKKLENDLRQISNTMSVNKLLSPEQSSSKEADFPLLYIKDRRKEAGVFDTVSKYPYEVFAFSGQFMKELKAYWLPVYIRNEAALFVSEVENISSQVQGLLQYGNSSDEGY